MKSDIYGSKAPDLLYMNQEGLPLLYFFYIYRSLKLPRKLKKPRKKQRKPNKKLWKRTLSIAQPTGCTTCLLDGKPVMSEGMLPCIYPRETELE
jgi:hypothetical protein